MDFLDYTNRLKTRHGDQFDASGLAPKFRQYFGQRIEVKFSCGTIKRGYVTGTTGWKPALMLLLRRNSMGSSWLLSDKDTLVQVFHERRL
jgi:hypothetical protein